MLLTSCSLEFSTEFHQKPDQMFLHTWILTSPSHYWTHSPQQLVYISLLYIISITVFQCTFNDAPIGINRPSKHSAYGFWIIIGTSDAYRRRSMASVRISIWGKIRIMAWGSWKTRCCVHRKVSITQRKTYYIYIRKKDPEVYRKIFNRITIISVFSL